MDWKTIELDDGIHDAIVVEEPTIIQAKNPWKAIVRGNHLTYGIDCRADTIIRGVRVEGSRIGVSSADDVTMTIEDCWIQLNYTQGIDSHGRLELRRCLVEHNGSDPIHDHNVYCHDQFDVFNSIIRDAVGWSLHGYNEANQKAVHGHVYDSLIVGKQAVVCRGHVCFHRCTIAGETSVVDDGMTFSDPSNLIDPTDETVVDVRRCLYWLRSDPGKRLGCYAFDPQLTLETAKTLWPGGSMYKCSADGGVFFPHFPGDSIPVKTELGGEPWNA